MKKWILFIGFWILVGVVFAQDCDNGTVSADQTICSGSAPATLSITDFSVGATFQWQFSLDNIAFTNTVGGTASTFSPGSLTNTTYYRVEVDGAACDPVYSDTIMVSVDQPPSAPPTAIAGYTSAICSGTSLTLTASGGDVGSGADYQWGKNEVNDANALFVGNPYSTDLLTVGAPYWVRLKGNTACQQVTAAFTKVVAVHQPPTAPTSITGAENTVCNGASVTLVAQGGVEGTGADYVWGSGSVVGDNIIDTTDNGSWDIPVLTASATFWVRRIASPASACTNTTGGVSQLVSVRPAPSVTITNPAELCQLPSQQVLVSNETTGQLPLQIQWATGTGLSGSSVVNANAEIELNLSMASTDNTNFTILSYGFTDAPFCTNSTPLSEMFDIKSRPAITSILHNDLTSTDNPLCQGYGPVEFVVSTPTDVDWVSSYYIDDQLNEEGLTETPFNLQIDLTGFHEFSVDSLWYNTGLACGHDPSDYELPGFYSDTLTIKPTPPAAEFVSGAPSILQFCNYASPLVVDSVARISDLNEWVNNGAGYAIKWKDTNDNSEPNLNDIPLEDGADYYPVLELNGCHSKLNSNSVSFIIDLMPLPDLVQSSLIFPSSICSGAPFDISFDPGINISHFSISNSNFDPSLSSQNINVGFSYPNIQGLGFSISNSSESASNWTADIYAQNKNVSTINPVTCWAEPKPIDISVNPNATFNPEITHFESCQNGSDFTIDPGWNKIGDADWDDPLGLPASISIDDSTKIITVELSDQPVPPGEYTIHISGGYLDSGCEVDTSFTVSIYASPEAATRILDVDGTICHNEYTHIEVIDPNPEYVYQWSCTGCESNTTQGTYFLPHWLNPEPFAGSWTDLSATYTITTTDTSTDQNCASSDNVPVNVLADYASCPEGIDFFLPNGLSVVDAPALYFQWYSVESGSAFSTIAGATDQTFFPNDALVDCDTSKYIVATSLYADRCWSTTVNCFLGFDMRSCDGPKSNESSPKFLLYPNPVVGNDIILENLSNHLEGRYSLELFDIAGKRLMSKIIQIEKTGQTKIVLPTVEEGVYLLRVSNSRYNQTFKFIHN